MNGSRAKAAWILGFTGLVVIVTAGSPAGAAEAEQGGIAQPLAAPLRLGPPTLLRPDESTDPFTGDQTDQNRGLRGIQVNPLGEIDPEAIGTLDPGNGGFGRAMWRGSDRAAIERLLPRLPGSISSSTMRLLARRLLLTNASPPKAVHGEAGHKSQNLLALRVDRLAALGDIQGLNELLRVVPQRHDDEMIARARVEGLLLNGEAANACQTVRRHITVQSGASYWRKALVFCQILSGEVDQAMLGVGLMREQGLSEDPAFFSLVDAYAGAEMEQVAVASPLHFAMLGAVGQPIPQELIDEASPGLLVAFTKSPQATLEQRALAGERAVAVGVLQPEMLVTIYEEFAFDPESQSDPAVVAADVSGPAGRALYYQAARINTDSAVRAEILEDALNRARGEGHYQVSVRVLLPMLNTIPVEPELIWFAEAAGRALYATGHYDRAGAWFTLARQEAVINPQAANVVAVLWPYSRLANSPALAWRGDLESWRAAREDASPDERSRQALLRGLFMSLGESDSLSWIDIASQTGTSAQPLPDAALLYALRDASETRRVGETVLLSLLVLGELGPSDGHPMALNAVLAALKQVGLESEARALAIEAAVARGI